LYHIHLIYYHNIKHTMECSICFEQFIRPTSNDNYTELYNEFMEKNNDDIKFLSLLLLPNQMPKHRCHNDRCDKYLCEDCYEKSIDDTTLFKCHYCRCSEYKIYMSKNVLRELQIKVLGEDGFRKYWKDQLKKLMEF